MLGQVRSREDRMASGPSGDSLRSVASALLCSSFLPVICDLHLIGSVTYGLQRYREAHWIAE